MEKRNLSLLMDFYELTMSNSYFTQGLQNQVVAFEVTYRRNPDGAGYSIFAGLEQVVDYITNLSFTKNDIDYLRESANFDEGFLEYLSTFKFKGDVYAFKEGTVMYPNEPVITVIAPLIDAQLVETMILIQVNHQSLIATKARRIVSAAKGRTVVDFGARRAHNADSAIYGARAAYIGGVAATATTLAAKEFDIPASGTMAHSYIMLYKTEYEAFLAYAKTYPENTSLLIDTYDVLKSGLKNAIRVQNEYLKPNGHYLKAVRIDSGDLAYLSKKVRKELDKEGLYDTKIILSNSLDEFTIASLLEQNTPVDFFGVGERLITARSEPVFGAIYKMVGVKNNNNEKFKSKVKLSETKSKQTVAGLKKVYRVFNKDGYGYADYLTLFNEKIDKQNDIKYISSNTESGIKEGYYNDSVVKPLQELIIKSGELVYDLPTLQEIRKYVEFQMQEEVWEEEKRFTYPHIHYMDHSLMLYLENKRLINELSAKTKRIIVFGGTFNPVSLGHINVAKKAFVEMNADNVIMVPTKDDFLKNWKEMSDKDIYSSDLRLKLLNLVASDHKWLIVEDCEINRYTSGRSFDLLEYTKDKHNTTDVYFLIGSDKLQELYSWYNATNLLNNNNFIVFNRDNDDARNYIDNDALLSKYKHNFIVLESDELTKRISSTKVRDLINTKNFSELKKIVPHSVYDYFYNHKNS